MAHATTGHHGGETELPIGANPRSLLGNVQRVFSRINKVSAVIGCIPFNIIMFITLYEVIARYILNDPTIWTLEISQYMMLIAIFLAPSYTLEMGGHIKVDFVVERFSPRKKRMALIASSFLSLIFFTVLAWKSVELAWSTYSLGMRSMSMLAVPLFPVYVFLPIGCVLMLIQGLLQFIQLIERKQGA